MLRDYQQQLKNDIFQSLNQGAKNVCAVLPTGGGKTVVMSDITDTLDEPMVIIAHRQELVYQISNTLAKFKLYHNIIASDNTIRFIVRKHIENYGRNYFNVNALCTVAGVDTIIRRTTDYNHIKYWMIDEGHHVLQDNKWGRAINMFPNARGIGWTATPMRADRKPLSYKHTGVFHDMCVGPDMRTLINRGFLCDFKIYGPQPSYSTDDIKLSKTGDFNQNQLIERARQSTIVGDVVSHYLRYAPGKRCVTFATDHKSCEDYYQAFISAGVPVAVLTAKTNDSVRVDIMERFRAGRILQLINVDIVGEGVDVPAVECVIFARSTASYPLYVQQFGRALRILPNKKIGIIIDAVDNVRRHHGAPDVPPEWSLEIPGYRQSQKRELPARICQSCTLYFESFSMVCPHCGHKPKTEPRDMTPVTEEGDLLEYTPELLASLRKKINNEPKIPYDASPVVKASIIKNHRVRNEARELVRDIISKWAGYNRDIKGYNDSEIYRKFFLTFGIDVLEAQTLPARKSNELAARILHDIPLF